jgi:hypothetical protein
MIKTYILNGDWSVTGNWMVGRGDWIPYALRRFSVFISGAKPGKNKECFLKNQ